MILGTSKGCYKFLFEDEFRILGCVMNRQGKTCDAVEERMQSANKAFWKDIIIFQKMSAFGGPRAACRLEVKPGHGHSRHWKKLKVGMTKIMTKLFRLKRRKGRDVGRVSHKNVYHGQEDLGADGSAFLYEKIAESMWRAMRWVGVR